MARRPLLENRTARRTLKARKKPYVAARLARGITLRYRRNKGAGTWDVKVADRGGAWTKAIGTADDHEPADGVHVLDYFQAADKARKLARGTNADSDRPLTVAVAIDAYEQDLVARNGDVANAMRVRKHLKNAPSLSAKPVALLGAADLSRFRDALLADGNLQRSSVRRTCRAFAAALALAARRDHRIRNQTAWQVGLAGIKDTFGTRNAQVLSDPQVHGLIGSAYAESEPFGLLVEGLAVTGARFSQLARLNVADLQADNGAPRLLMPASRKGRGQRKITHHPVPITAALAAKLKRAANNRPPDSPLLTRSDGERWQTNDHWKPFQQAAARAGLSGHSAYCLRHTAIVRSLLANVPLRLCAAIFDTSASQIEATYSAYIADHADDIARRGLLAAPAANVVALSSRKS
jgi:integrase